MAQVLVEFYGQFPFIEVHFFFKFILPCILIDKI